MKTLKIFALFLFGTFYFAQGNYVQINGSTNINNFKCVNDSFKSEKVAEIINGKSLPNITLKVDDFDCKNKIMTSDFKKTLDADDYPALMIKFLNIQKKLNIYNAKIEVKMMDKSRVYNINLCLQNGKLTGKSPVKFSDFNIKPPKKMGGMVVVKDDLNLVFALDAS